MNRYDRIMESLIDPSERAHLELFPAPSEEDLQEIEASLGVKLPKDYRDFLKDYAWAAVHRTFRLSNGELGHIDFFRGVNGGKYDILGCYKTNLDERPPYVIDIGDSDAGTVFMSLKYEEKGAIYFLDNWEATKPIFLDNLVFVANSFDDFISILLQYK